MSARLGDFEDGVGETIQKTLDGAAGQSVDYICIAFPSLADNWDKNPQPTFLTTVPPELMESLLTQIGAQMHRVAQSRIVVQHESFDRRPN